MAQAAPQIRGTGWNSLVFRIGAGEEDALSRLYDESSPMVYGLALRILRDAADAEEVTIEVYVQAWRTAGSFDAGRANAATWLMLLARSRSLDRLRSRAIREKHEEPLESGHDFSAAGCPEESAVLGQQREMVRAALNALPQEQRSLIELAFFSGLSHSELADLQGQPLGTVKTRIRLGMMRMRELLAPAASSFWAGN